MNTECSQINAFSICVMSQILSLDPKLEILKSE